MGSRLWSCRPSDDRGPSGVPVTLLDEVGQVALAAVVTVEVHGHEDAGPAHLVRALATQARDLVVGVDLVELQHCKLHLLALVLDLLGLGVGLLLALLCAAGELQVQEDGGFVLEAARRQHLRIRERAAAKDQALLVSRDALLRADVLLQALNGGRRVRVDREGLAIDATDEELHGGFYRATARMPRKSEPPLCSSQTGLE